MLPRKPPRGLPRALAVLFVGVVTSLSQDIPLQTKLLKNVEQPPTITKQPPKVYYVDPTDDIHIECEAKGNPAPSFNWTKDGQHFDPSLDSNIVMLNNSGSFRVRKSSVVLNKSYEGDYQCIASNDVGKALSEKIQLRLASTPKWPKEVLKPKKVDVGKSVVLPCDPPFGLPPPVIYWMTKDLDHIRQNSRVTQGLNGDLYFANVISSDSRDDYICYAQFKASRTIIQKEPIQLQVNTLGHPAGRPSHGGRQPHAEPPAPRPAKLLTPLGKSSTKHALRGDDLLLECIAEGLPTPTISWRKLDGNMPEGTLSYENFKKLLRISPVSLRNAGQYQCTVANDHGSDTHTFDVTIDAAPYWTSRPEGKTVVPGDDANLYCEADGKPKPKIQWLIDGIPVEAAKHNPDRIVRGDLITLKRLRIGDSAVYQCQATNKHGSTLANVFVNVLAVAPLIQTEDNKVYEVVEHKAVALECKAFGSPKPVMQWSKEKSANVVNANGNLLIKRVTKGDQGLYVCTATNQLNSTTITAILLVRDATRIEPMEPLRLEKLTDARFVCNASYDEHLNFTLYWEKNGAELITGDRVVSDGGVLTVRGITAEDEGTYTCFGVTPLDRGTASATLTVLDRPAAPTQLTLGDLRDRSVELLWEPGDNHNSPISVASVEFEEDTYKPGVWQSLDNFSGDATSAKLQLRPYVNYRFRLITHNELGASEPSEPSERYFTPPSTPDIAPYGVKAEGTEPDKMVVSWKPLEPMDSNGVGLQYKVSWREKGHRQPWEEKLVPGNESHFVLSDTPPFTPYEVKVQAVNNQGSGPEPIVIVGYSGEDAPRVAPDNVRCEAVNSTAISVSWDPLSSEDVRGRLQGYKIYYWKVRGMLERRRRHTGKKSLVLHGARNSGLLPGLEPFSVYKVEVAAFNGRSEGPPSAAIITETPEGVPGEVVDLKITQTTLSSVNLEWKPPSHPNGVITGYLLTYQAINSTTQEPGPIQSESILPNTTMCQLSDLEPETKYMITVGAQTSVGLGKMMTEEAKTVMDFAHFIPELPSVTTVPWSPPKHALYYTTGPDFVNISWIPTYGQEEYAVEYREQNDDKWNRSPLLNSSTSFYVIKDLNPGTPHSVRLVTQNNDKMFMSEEIPVTIIGSSKQDSTNWTTTAWFIALLCLIALIILILLIICFIKRNKGGKYSVKDKEDARADPDIKPMKEETFGEYRPLESDNDEKPLAASVPSLNGSVPHGDSEDSLAQYGDGVEGMFNEDGSFIGQYRGSKERVSSTTTAADGGPAPPGGSTATSPVAAMA